MNQSQFTYLVSPRPWPILTANSLLLITSGFNNTFVLYLVKIFVFFGKFKKISYPVKRVALKFGFGSFIFVFYNQTRTFAIRGTFNKYSEQILKGRKLYASNKVIYDNLQYRELFCKIFNVRAFKIEIAKGHIVEVVSLAEQKERNHQKWLAEYAVNVEKNRRISPMDEEIFPRLNAEIFRTKRLSSLPTVNTKLTLGDTEIFTNAI